MQTSWMTEQQNENSTGLDQKPIKEILNIINREDQQVATAVSKAIDQIEQAVEAFVNTYAKGGNIFYIGAGTSGRLGILDAVECPPTFSTSPDRIQGILAGGIGAFSEAIEGQEDDRKSGQRLVAEKEMTPDDLMVGIAASGQTPFVLGAIETAKQHQITTVGITNNPNGALVELADIPIVAAVGPEVVAGSTRLKAGTAQKMILNMISTTSMVKLGKVYDNYMVDVKATNKKLRRRAMNILQNLTHKPEEQIETALKESDYDVKTSLLMLKADVPFDAAASLLNQHHGFVNRALEALRSGN